MLTILCGNAYFSNQILLWSCTTSGYYLRWFHPIFWNISSVQSLLYTPPMILRVLIISRSSVSKVGKSNFFNHSSYDNSFSYGNVLVVLLCTFSIAWMSLIKCGHHTWLAYSTWGLTSAVYSPLNISVSKCVNIHLIIPVILFAMLILSDRCSEDNNLSSITTFMSFSTLVISISVCSKYPCSTISDRPILMYCFYQGGNIASTSQSTT